MWGETIVVVIQVIECSLPLIILGSHIQAELLASLCSLSGFPVASFPGPIDVLISQSDSVFLNTHAKDMDCVTIYT